MPTLYLEIPNYPDNQAPGQTFTAVAKIVALNADFDKLRGHIRLAVYRNIDAMTIGAVPVEELIIQAGGRIVRGGLQTGVTYPDMTSIQNDNLQAWGALWQYFLTKATTLNGLTGSTIHQI